METNGRDKTRMVNNRAVRFMCTFTKNVHNLFIINVSDTNTRKKCSLELA